MWLIFGVIAIFAIMINLLLISKGRYKFCVLLIWISLSSALMAMLSAYSLINSWIQDEDMSALLNVIPTLNKILMSIVLIGIALNAIAMIVYYQRFKSISS